MASLSKLLPRHTPIPKMLWKITNNPIKVINSNQVLLIPAIHPKVQNSNPDKRLAQAVIHREPTTGPSDTVVDPQNNY